MLRLPAPNAATQGCWGSYHSKWQPCRSWRERDSMQAVAKDLKAQLCGWATLPAKCHPALKVAGPPRSRPASSSAKLTLQLGRHSLCSSSEAEMLQHFSCPTFSPGQPQQSHYLPLSQYPLKWKHGGGGALGHPLWLSQTPGMCAGSLTTRC